MTKRINWPVVIVILLVFAAILACSIYTMNNWQSLVNSRGY